MKSSKVIAALCAAAVMTSAVSVLPASAALKNITYPELKVEDKRLGDYMDLGKLTDCGAAKKVVVTYTTESLDDNKPAGAMAVFAESKGWGWDPVELGKISVKNNDGSWTATLPVDLKSSDKSAMLIINEYFADEYKSTMVIKKMQVLDANGGLLYSTDKEENKNAIKPASSSSSSSLSSTSSNSSSSSSSSSDSTSSASSASSASSDSSSSSASSESSSSTSESSSSSADSSSKPDNGKYALGDVDGNGSVNVADIAVTAAFIKGMKALSTDAYTAADVNKDTQVNVTDIAMIASHIKGIKALSDNVDTSSKPDNSSSSSQAESSSSTADSSSSQAESSSSAADSSSVAESSSSSTAESSSSQPDSSSSQPDTQATYTSKGYKIEQIDGVTYVDGTLVVNKSYGLPENYGNGLTKEFSDALYEMQGGAWADGVTLYVVSGFRSYNEQNDLYWNYVNRDGQPAADTYSARAGHSEHQSGLAADLNNASPSFNGTQAAQWLQAHCAEYGFIIRYPYGKESQTGFMYESWHVRYVGKELAKKITDSGLSLEEYYGIDSYYH